MRLDLRLAMLGLFLLVLLGVATVSRAQYAYGARPVPPVVLAGPDVGFRMVAVKGDTPVGQLVVRVNGEWKVVEFGLTTATPLGK